MTAPTRASCPGRAGATAFFMMCLDAPAAAETVAEAGWMLDNDPQEYQEAIGRADEFYGGHGGLDAHLATVLPKAPDDAASRAFFQQVGIERAKLGMSSPGMPGGHVTLGDLNQYLRAQVARTRRQPADDRRGQRGAGRRPEG